MSKFKDILELCRKTGFIIGGKVEEMHLGPLGALLSENLRKEWLYSNVYNRDINVLLNNNSSTVATFNYVKDLCGDRVPFGLAKILEINPEYKNENTDEINSCFYPSAQVTLQSQMFVSPTDSDQVFYNWQNQRRIWWRKISAYPGLYSLTDIQRDETGRQSVDIVAKHSWGTHIMEAVTLNPAGHAQLTKDQLQVRDGRRRVQAHCISSSAYLFTMTLNMMCDAYDDAPYQGVRRPLFRFHRKLAPYKCGFSIGNANASDTDELNDLALYICRKLRKAKFSVLYNSNCHRTSLESQWSQHDEMGIPYTILLNEGTLKNGILHLRSRDTTLKEQVHVTDLPAYIEKIFKNY